MFYKRLVHFAHRQSEFIGSLWRERVYVSKAERYMGALFANWSLPQHPP